jgi:hypothetical protein
MPPRDTFRGVVHGNVIELERSPGLPDGQSVTVTVTPQDGKSQPAPGEGLRRAFGGWAEDAAGLDEFLEQTRRDRSDDRAEPNP